ncbi:caspase family protein [Pseudomonas syringae group genomosp. 3]|uniref:caspase family protein n=1 Tax=Pseudomonas syringae group genomosp. 3 TaxID=251701 RepID=UPI001C7F4DB0|nr:caspase family protein [Pseudomonas syringae group genomosp. 3]
MSRKGTVTNAGKAARFDKPLQEMANPKRVSAFVIGLENYRKDELPKVDFAHADADAFRDALIKIFSPETVEVNVLKDAEASLTAVKDELAYAIRNLEDDELFIFYYAGHGFHGEGDNRLSVYDTSPTNIGDTTLNLQKDLLKRLEEHHCQKALIFVDACAANFADVVKSRDVISNLDAAQVKKFLDSNWYRGVFLSCSPREKSYPAMALGHGVWTHFLLEALEGRAQNALRDRWLTDTSLQDYLRNEVPSYITRNMTVKGTQTPQAIISSSGSFRIRYVEETSAVTAPADAALASIVFNNDVEYLEGIETGRVRTLNGFKTSHREPDGFSEAAERFCRNLLNTQITEEIQEVYEDALTELGGRRKHYQKGEDHGAGDLDHQLFRYSIGSGQNPEDHTEYAICRSLELRDGWEDHREAIGRIFDGKFDYLVIGFKKMKIGFDDLVDALEDVQESHGGTIVDDDRLKRVSYSRDGAIFTFDLTRLRLEIEISGADSLAILDGARQFQLGNRRSSPMLTAPA